MIEKSNNKKLLILGAKGMLAYDIQKIFSQEYELFLCDQEDGDITQENILIPLVQKIHPRIIINCAAYTNVDSCETEKDLAYAINGHALKHISKAAKQVQATLIHISTDYVFDGNKQEGYKENDTKNPLSIYGKSKALGEDILLQHYPEKSYIIRTAWLYGKNGKNFVSTMLQLAQEGKLLKIVDDQIGSPTSTKDVAQAIFQLLQNEYPCGIYHIVNSGQVSWYHFAKEIFKTKDIHVTIQPVKTSDFPRPAKRPAYSVLKNTKFPILRPWQEGLKDFLQNYKIINYKIL